MLWDNWTENQIEFMKQVGNKNINEFFQKYHIKKNFINKNNGI